MVGGEQANNEEVKERRKKKKKYAEERRKKLLGEYILPWHASFVNNNVPYVRLSDYCFRCLYSLFA